MLSISTTQLFSLLSEKVGTDTAEKLTTYIEQKIEKEVGLNALSNCRKQLSEKDQEILTIYDAASGKDKKLKRNQLAENLDKTKNALKIYINRLRNKLIDCARKKIQMKLSS